ncbi:hypothetical protein [uncultured Secundilactobacillus sp.]|uniref:hypothetical protein n=1 Tax=uncultured Secundilactobacillus sp. TaxID=2813935 RepID=UPI002595C735|nr:hypothetical protein [uncultured Secundilactobacillus sp.]
MKQAGIRSLMNRRYKKPSTQVEFAQRPNLIKSLHSRASVWRADITYLDLGAGHGGYLSTILDETHNRVVTHNYGQSMTADLVVNTLKIALKNHEVPKFYHSDMGS